MPVLPRWPSIPAITTRIWPTARSASWVAVPGGRARVLSPHLAHGGPRPQPGRCRASCASRTSRPARVHAARGHHPAEPPALYHRVRGALGPRHPGDRGTRTSRSSASARWICSPAWRPGCASDAADAVRLQYDPDLPAELLATLVDRARAPRATISTRAPASPPSRISSSSTPRWTSPRLKDQPHAAPCAPRPSTAPPTSWSAIRNGDVLAHHPYHSFDAVTRFVSEAAVDPRVLAIKMTLYRVSPTSPVAEALTRGGGGRQGGCGAGRAAGPRLRRGGQHPVGARARGSGSARGLWAGRLQDALQGVPGGAAGGRRHPPLLPSGHRQLQRADGRDLRRHRPVHLPGVVRRRPDRAVQPPHRLHASPRLPSPAGGADRAAGRSGRASAS